MTTYAELIQQEPRYIKIARDQALTWDTDDYGVALVDDPSNVTDADVFQYLYHHPSMTPEGKRILEGINRDRKGGLITRLQSALVDPRNEKAFQPIWRVLTDASITQKGGKNTLLYSPKSMQSLYKTQSDIYDDYGIFKGFGWKNSPSVSRVWLNPNAHWKNYLPFRGKIDKAIRDKIYKVTANEVIFGNRENEPLDLSNKEWYNGKESTGGPLKWPGAQQGGMHYVAPALAAGVPLALIGGMMSKRNPLMTGLGILGAAGIAGAAYGMAKDKNWKGWSPVEKFTNYYDNAFRKQSSVEHGLPYTIDNASPSTYLTELALGSLGESSESTKGLPYYPSSSPSDTSIY